MNEMKKLSTLFTIALVGNAMATYCVNPRLKDPIFSSDHYIYEDVTDKYFIKIKFTLVCDNDLPRSYGLYADIDGDQMPGFRLADNKFLFHGYHMPSAPRPRVYQMLVYEEDDWIRLKTDQKYDPDAAKAPMLRLQLNHTRNSGCGSVITSFYTKFVIISIESLLALLNNDNM
nr:uncharacterized protein LOC128682522 [Plodia interpunctella]